MFFNDGNEGFFSAYEHKSRPEGTREFRNARTGEIRPINFVGQSVEGTPGYIDVDDKGKGRVVRLVFHETYKFVGKVEKGEFDLTDKELRKLGHATFDAQLGWTRPSREEITKLKQETAAKWCTPSP
jgi:hypothetical protein